jgi:hypothetical protein
MKKIQQHQNLAKDTMSDAIELPLKYGLNLDI